MNLQYNCISKKPFISICICTIESRKTQFENLVQKLLEYSKGMEIEIISLCDNKEMSVGNKRNILIGSANGIYSAFIDDDDMVDSSYFSRIFEASKTMPDVIGLEGIITFSGTNPHKFIHSLKYDKWFEKDGIYYRNPNHLNPIKLELSRQVKFPEKNFMEDRDFSRNILPLLRTEVYVNYPIYFYQFDQNKSETARYNPNIK